MTTRTILVSMACGLLGVASTAQQVLRRIDGTQDGMALGTAVANAGDFDGDGIPDQLVGSPLFDADDSPFGPWPDAGRAQVFSGADGSVLWTSPTLSTPMASEGMAFQSVDGVGDYDGDGRDDIVVGVPGIAVGGLVTVYSGATGTAIAQLGGEVCGCNSFAGQAVAGIGDWDGDGTPDLVWGDAPDGLYLCWEGGGASIEAGGGGHIATTGNCQPERAEEGDAVSGGDFNGDGLADVIIGIGGSPGYATNEKNRVKIFIGPTLTTRFLIDFDNGNGIDQTPNHHEWVRGLGDINQDGFDDFAVAAIFPEPGPPSVRVFSGQNASILFDFAGVGDRPAAPGDVDGDGVPDILIGDQHDYTNGTDAGVARLYSGVTGALLLERFGEGPGNGYGASVSGAGDLDGDGRNELLIGALGGPNNPAGFVEIVRFVDSTPTTYCSGKVNSQGCVPAIDSSGSPSITGTDDFRLLAQDTLVAKPGLLFFGTSGRVAVPFLGGTLCVQAPLTRTAPSISTGLADCHAGNAFYFSQAFMNSAGLTAGDVVNGQFWMRDPDQADGTGVALTNALEFKLLP